MPYLPTIRSPLTATLKLPGASALFCRVTPGCRHTYTGLGKPSLRHVSALEGMKPPHIMFLTVVYSTPLENVTLTYWSHSTGIISLISLVKQSISRDNCSPPVVRKEAIAGHSVGARKMSEDGGVPGNGPPPVLSSKKVTKAMLVFWRKLRLFAPRYGASVTPPTFWHSHKILTENEHWELSPEIPFMSCPPNGCLEL